MNIGERLTTKIGPLPVWAWGGIGAAIVWFLIGRGGTPNALIGTQSSGDGGGAGAGPDRVPGGGGTGAGGGPPDPILPPPPGGGGSGGDNTPASTSGTDNVIMSGQVPILEPIWTSGEGNPPLGDIIYDTTGGALNLRTHVYTPADRQNEDTGYDLIFGPNYKGPTSSEGVSGPGLENWMIDNGLAPKPVSTLPTPTEVVQAVDDRPAIMGTFIPSAPTPEPAAVARAVPIRDIAPPERYDRADSYVEPVRAIRDAAPDWSAPVPQEVVRQDPTTNSPAPVRDVAPPDRTVQTSPTEPPQYPEPQTYGSRMY